MKNRKMKPISVIAGSIFGYMFAAIVVFYAVGFVISFTWNFTMPHLFGLPTMNVYKGFALIVLTRMLFFGFSKVRK